VLFVKKHTILKKKMLGRLTEWLATSAQCEEAPEKNEEEQVAAEEEEQVAEEEEPEQEEEAASEDIVVKTTPFDPRFPQQNQAKHCYTRYNEYHKCAAENGEEECASMAKLYRSICPGEWVEKWNEERENGTWPGRY